MAYLDARRRSETSRDTTPTEELVEQALDGDRSACRILYDRYRARVNQTASRLALSSADADDLVQDAFAFAFDQLHRLREPSSFGEWVRSMVIRSAAKRLRRHRVARRLGLVEGSAYQPIPLGLSDNAPPEAVVEIDRIREALHRLPSDAGVALVLHRVEGFTLREIAEHLGVSEPTVKRRIRRALSALKEDGA